MNLTFICLYGKEKKNIETKKMSKSETKADVDVSWDLFKAKILFEKNNSPVQREAIRNTLKHALGTYSMFVNQPLWTISFMRDNRTQGPRSISSWLSRVPVCFQSSFPRQIPLPNVGAVGQAYQRASPSSRSVRSQYGQKVPSRSTTVRTSTKNARIIWYSQGRVLHSVCYASSNRSSRWTAQKDPLWYSKTSKEWTRWLWHFACPTPIFLSMPSLSVRK